MLRHKKIGFPHLTRDLFRGQASGPSISTRSGGPLCKCALYGAILLLSLLWSSKADARDVAYRGQEIDVFVLPGEPTQINFPEVIAGGFRKKGSAISLDRKISDLIIFARESLSPNGEAIIVRLRDGRSYSLRIRRANDEMPRDDMIKIDDLKGTVLTPEDKEEEPPYKDKKFDYAPPSQTSGLVREMTLHTEFGKGSISGYRVSEKHRGQVVLFDGNLRATVDKIFVGPMLWGYVLDAENLLDQSQKISPSTFRIDGTQAISMTNWELAPRPVTVEQEIAGRHKTKIYIVTRAR